MGRNRNIFDDLAQLFDEVEEVEQLSLVLKSALGLLQAHIDARFDSLEALLSPPPAASVGWRFSTSKPGEINMPLSMPQNRTDEKYFVIGQDASGLTGAPLAKGQTVTAVSSDPNTVVLTPDATPGVDNEGVQSVASGSVTVGPTPVLNTPVTCTLTVLNADGSTAESQTDTATITPAVPGVATSIGVLFEEPVSGVTAARKV